MQRDDLLAWMDLEMTSVTDARVDQIIEAAIILTDRDLNVVAEGPSLVIHADTDAFRRIPESARALHEKNGLLAAAPHSTLSLAEAEERMLAFLSEHAVLGTAPLCGNSIHVDRHFLALQMPRLEKYLYYRNIDVSTVKELAKYWKPAVYEEARSRKGESAHRAKDDIMASISELRFYRGAFFS